MKSLEVIKGPHQELDKNIDNLNNLIGAAAERNSMAFARISFRITILC